MPTGIPWLNPRQIFRRGGFGLSIELDERRMSSLLERIRPQVLYGKIRGALAESGPVIRNEVQSRVPKDTGRMRKSIGVSSGFGSGMISPIAGLSITVGTPLEYGAALELGRSAGKFPPVPSIAAWVARRIAPSMTISQQIQSLGRGGLEGVRRRRLQARLAQLSSSITFLIARKIAETGTPAHHMFRDGLRAARPRVATIFRRWLGKL